VRTLRRSRGSLRLLGGVLLGLVLGLVLGLLLAGGHHGASSGASRSAAGPLPSSGTASATGPRPPPYPVACGTSVCLSGAPMALVGTNAFGLATSREHNFGCGPQADDVDGLLQTLPRGAVVRVWAFQGLARNPGTRSYDFGGLDRLFDAAERAHVLLLPVLSDQTGTCDDGHWRDDAYYAGGYRQAFDDDGAGRAPAPFWEYLAAVVPRYAGSAALFGWELVNEPQAARCSGGPRGSACYAALSCPVGADTALRGFYDTVGARTRELDGHRHLLVMGVIGTGQCGANAGQYAELLASPGVDVATYHDYGAEDDPLPTGLEERLGMAAGLGKPLLVEEAGIAAGDPPGCRSGRSRALLLEAKAHAARRAGAIGLLPWNLQPGEQECGYDFGPQQMLRDRTVALTAADPDAAGPQPARGSGRAG